MNYVYYPDELYHFGVKGQKWGERRWQNPDGSLTPEGRIHYGYNANYDNAQIKRDREKYGQRGVNRINREMNRGANISGARAKEINRIRTATSIYKRANRYGAYAGMAAGYIFGGDIANYVDRKVRSERLHNFMLNNKALTLNGIAILSGTIGSEIGRLTVSALYGYTPNQLESRKYEVL